MKYTPEEFIKWWTGEESPTIGYWQNKLTKWSKAIKTGTDLYFHVQEHDLEKLGRIAADEGKTMACVRGRKATCTRIFGLVLDIDVGDKGTDKEYYPDLDSAKRAAAETKPSAIVASGGGLHVYYKLSEPIVVDDIEKEAAWLKRWGKSMQMEYAYDTDPVYDVSRVMRWPGSKHKNGNTVEVLAMGGPLYRKSQMTFKSMDDLKYKSPQLSQLFNNQVPGMKDASRVCFRLASALLAKGWSDNAVRHALVQWRMQHAKDMKLNRSDDWYQRTIDAARDGKMTETESPIELLTFIVTEATSVPEPVLTFFRMLFNSTAEIRKETPKVGKDYKAGAPVYVINTGEADIVFPSRVLVSFSLFRNLILDHTGVMLPTMKSIGGRWESFVQAFVSECENRTSSSFASDEAFVAESIFEYFHDAAEGDKGSVRTLRSIDPPIVHKENGVVTFRSSNMLGWVNQTLGVKISAQAISGVLQSVGADRKAGGMWEISDERISN